MSDASDASEYSGDSTEDDENPSDSASSIGPASESSSHPEDGTSSSTRLAREGTDGDEYRRSCMISHNSFSINYYNRSQFRSSKEARQLVIDGLRCK